MNPKLILELICWQIGYKTTSIQTDLMTNSYSKNNTSYSVKLYLLISSKFKDKFQKNE